MVGSQIINILVYMHNGGNTWGDRIFTKDNLDQEEELGRIRGGEGSNRVGSGGYPTRDGGERLTLIRICIGSIPGDSYSPQG